MADTKVPKNHFYLDLSLFFFVMAMVMIVIFCTPLFVTWYVDFFSGSTRERMQWYEIVLGFIPIVLYIVSSSSWTSSSSKGRIKARSSISGDPS